MTKVLCLSDLHGFLPDNLPKSDILLIAGDLVGFDDEGRYNWYYDVFLPWMIKQTEENTSSIVFIAGNHDFFFETEDSRDFLLKLPANITYLENDSIVLDGIKIYGTPWITNLPSWAFNAPERDLWVEWNSSIPYECDIILSHGPPHSCRDFIYCNYTGNSINVGTKAMYNIAIDKRPKYIVCGHIHEGYGKEKLNAYTTVINCSIKNKEYEPVNKPIMLEI